MEGEKIVANDATDKGLNSKMYIYKKKLIQFNKKVNPIKKIGKRSKWLFLKDTWMTSKHMKKKKKLNITNY